MTTAQTVFGTPSTMGDDEQLTTTRLFSHAARSFGSQQIVHRDQDGDWHTTTYAETWRRIRRLAAGLREYGVGPGDRVGLLMWNDVRHFESYFAIPALGATMVQLNLRLAPKDIAYVIEQAGVTHIIVDESLASLAGDVDQHLNTRIQRWFIGTDHRLSDAQVRLHNVHSYDSVATHNQPLEDLPNVDERSASGACFTTGTTGRPKGVFYSHRSTWLHADALAVNVGIGLHDTVMLLTPMFHVQCWGLPYAAVKVGAKIVLPGRFTMQQTPMLVEAMTENAVTVAPAAPAILNPILHQFQQLEQTPDLSGTRFICGASEPPLSLMRGIWELTGAEVIHAYGATETSPIVSVNRVLPAVAATMDEEQRWRLRRSQGMPVVGVDVKIADPMGQPLPFDGASAGEIRLRGPWVTRSYFEDPEADESAFDEEGYWCSGDVGTVDENGFLKVTDRLKDIIKSGGEWISSIDMENTLAGRSEVGDVAVVGVSHPKWGERPLVLVVPTEGAEVTAETVRQALSEDFADWQLPDKVEVVDEIPRTSVGKINKRSLRETYAEAYQDA
ncbi:MAG: long-chain-fatty-acid--CoA ligase [Nesterenkonia sp.]|nr:long-chain-fatty-acid--CoA ligase [Nesterenkonia sp.]